jgi:hypothetical protein
MSRMRLAALALCTALAACGSTTDVTDSTTTNWRTLPIPSGGATTLALHMTGSSVTGTGQDYGLMGVPAGTFAVNGAVVRGAVHLTIAYSDGTTALYDATINATDLRGTWTPGSQAPFARTFNRQ